MNSSMFFTIANAVNAAQGEPDVTTVVVTGISIVFGVLILLYALITLEGVIFGSIEKKGKEKKDAASAVKPVAPKAVAPVAKPAVETGIPGEVIAAISAAIAAMESGSSYVIRSVSRVKKGRSSWSSAGVSSNTDPF